MTQPLALVCYEHLLPGSQIVNGLRDLGYRVQPIADARALAACAEQAKPLVVFADLATTGVCDAIRQLKQDPSTGHVPVIAFGNDEDMNSQDAARGAGATFVVSASGLLPQLKELLDQALEVP